MKKVVINQCYGGFGLSQEAYVKLNEWGIPIIDYVEPKRDPVTNLFEPFEYEDQEVIIQGDGFSSRKEDNLWDTWTCNNREHELLIRVVEELGAAASDEFAKLEVVEIPDDVNYEIDDYDGIESIHEIHRSWP